MRTVQELQSRGVDVELITTQVDEDQVLGIDAGPRVQIFHVTDSRVSESGKGSRALLAHSLAPLKVVRELRELSRARNFDVLHVWGFARTAELGAAVRLAGIGIPVVATVFAAPATTPSGPRRALWNRLDAVVTGTEHSQREMRDKGLPAELLRHGSPRDLLAELGPTLPEPRRDRVLFWRELTASNGADVAMAAFEALAPRFPDLRFTFALRPSREPEVAPTKRDHENMETFRAPYRDGLGLGELVSQARCVVLPFRELSMNPQLALIESLAAGVPVVTTDVGSNREYVQPGKTGALIPVGDVKATVAAIESLASDPERAAELGRNAAETMRRLSWQVYTERLVSVYRRAIVRNS